MSLAASPNTSDNFSDLIELDRAPTAPDEPSETLDTIELDMEPSEPQWLRDARVAIQGATTHAALNVAVATILAKHLSEPQKAQIRPILVAQRGLIDCQATIAQQNHARRPTPARGLAMVAAAAAVATGKTDADDVAAFTAAAAQISGSPPVQLVAGGSGGVYHTVTAQPAPASLEARPMIAGWQRIDVGPAKGQWGVRVEHMQHGVAIEPPMVGDRVIANSRNGARSQVKAISGVVRLDTARGFSLCTVTDPAPGARATLIRPRVVAPASLVAPATAPAPAPAALEAPSTVELSLGQSLGDIAAEGAANAGVSDLGAQSAAGVSSTTGRRLGVGFSTWQQYAEALRRGGLQPTTRAEYIATVRRMGGTIDESTLPAANAPSALPVGPGIKHTPTGPSIFDQPKAQRGFKVGQAAQEVRSGAALLRKGDLIAGAIAGGAGGDFSWAGRGKITRAALIAVLTEVDRLDDAPAAKNAHAQAGRAVTGLRSQGYHVHAVQGTERKSLPSYVAHRYIVGRALTTDTSTAIGAEYGQRVLVVDLHEDDTMHCEGQGDLAAKVRADFEARCADDVYISADLTSWLQHTLRSVHGATRFGVGWYVPAGERDSAERLTRAVAKIWGESWRHGMPVAACSHLFEGLTEGLSDEVIKIEEAWAGAKDEAREAHRVQVTTAKAAGLLARLAEVSERVRGYAVLLGDDVVAPLRAKLAKLDSEIRPLTDDTSARASMLEFS